MSTLHTVNKSPFERNALQSCVRHMMTGDAMIMIEDGVVGARKGTSASRYCKGRARKRRVYVLASDLAARGHEARASDRRRKARRLRRLC